MVDSETQYTIEVLLGKRLPDEHGERVDEDGPAVINDVVAQRCAATELGNTGPAEVEVKVCLARAALTHWERDVREAAHESLNRLDSRLATWVAYLATASLASEVRETGLRALCECDSVLCKLRAREMLLQESEVHVREVAVEVMNECESAEQGPVPREHITIPTVLAQAALVLSGNGASAAMRGHGLTWCVARDSLCGACLCAALYGRCDRPLSEHVVKCLGMMPEVQAMLAGCR